MDHISKAGYNYYQIILNFGGNPGMFKDTFGSPRFSSQTHQQNVSILSPRNFLKLISSGIDQFKKATFNSPNKTNYDQFITVFDPYLATFKQQYSKFKSKKSKPSEGNDKHQQLQLQIRLNRIPTGFFVEPQNFPLQLYKRNEMKKKQQELGEYLDEIEIVLFAKSGKYPEKTNIILSNVKKLEQQANFALKKVAVFRKDIKDNVLKSSLKQLQIKTILQKKKRLEATINVALIMKKVQDLKNLSLNSEQKKNMSQDELLLTIKKSELEICSKFRCIKKDLSNIETYRMNVKDKILKEFVQQIQIIFNKLLKYNKQQWKSIRLPQSLFTDQNDQNNVSHNNITILDQSYFAFDQNPVQFIKNSAFRANNYQIQEQNEQEGEDILNLSKLYQLWKSMKQFDLYDEAQLNQNLFRVLVKHNTAFNQDMQEYVNYLYEQTKRDKNTIGNFRKGMTLAQIKLKQSIAKEEDTTQQTHQFRLSSLDMKLYVKVVKFYFFLLKKIVSLISNHKELQFLLNFKEKFCSFVQDRIGYFMNLKKLSHQLKNQDFYGFLQIISFWDTDELYQIQQYCEKLKCTKIQEYLTAIQKNLLIKQIKQNIEASTYLPINLSSDNYMAFLYLLSLSNQQQDPNVSVMDNYHNHQRKNQERQNRVLRLINQNLFYKNKIYKVCDSFLDLIKNIERYARLKENLYGFQQNIQEKICEVVGFYAWYNQKNITNTKNGSKTLKNYCTFFSTLLFLKQLLPELLIVNKKFDKTKIQLNECQNQISKTITMTPFMMIEQKISQLYESKIIAKQQPPAPQTQRIIDIIKISTQCLKEYFPLQYEDKINESYIFKFLQTSIKLIKKNYFGYLLNMEKRGIMEVRWFIPKIKEIMEVTIIRNDKILDKKGQLICKNGNNTFYIFGEEIQEMQKALKMKIK